MKKFIAFVVSLLLTAACLLPGACFAEGQKAVKVVTTIFPIYDWTREAAGADADNMDITMLLDNGVDLHSYQPSAQDILAISSADLFIYVGGESDEWVEDVIASAMNPDLKAVSLLDALGDDVKAEEVVEGMEHEHDHDHEDHNDVAAERMTLFQRQTGMTEDGVASQELQAYLFSDKAPVCGQTLPRIKSRVGGSGKRVICGCCMGEGCERCNFTGWVDY